MRVRKSFSRMPQFEREAFLAALLRMKNTIANPMEPDPSRHISIYDQFVLIHNAADSRIRLNGGPLFDPAHQGSAFGPWHREFLLRFELELQTFDPTVMLPYWDWTDGPGNMNIIFDEFGMGPDGAPINGDVIPIGYFAPDRPGTGANTTPLPAWYPATMNGWHCDPRLVIATSYNDLRRNIGAFASLATQANVRTTLDAPSVPQPTDAATYMAFRSQLEGGPNMHNAMHNWFGVGSHMRNPAQSPNDPMFFLHHCNCDRLWAMWQMDGHEGTSFYQVTGGVEGHNLPDPMWPWVGGLPGYTSTYISGTLVAPDYSAEAPRTAADVIDHRNIVLNGVNVGYAYDTQVIVGIALDRTGSMTGPTPDPLSGMPPNVTKWNAARQGVGHFLQDAEAAYQAAEAYVVGGVNTFRSSGGANEVVPVAAATPKYGVVKAGSPYGQAAFNADIAGVTPQGGTPLAAALSGTEDGLVRPPFMGKPDEEQRYMCILTDGIETAPPLLSTLANPEFPETVIFAMGFGIGGGWNGVDYGTIAMLKDKGRPAPAGVQQAFHGENAAAIDKFFTNSIAHSLGFAPATDPRFELYPGEMLMMPFEVTCSDQVFMITVQGFDFNDKNWAFHLRGPDGAMYAQSAGTPYFVTMVRRDARLTVFLNRSHGPADGWEGTWNVIAVYRPDAKHEFMYMPNETELLIAAGAPPLLGPVYTRFDQPAAKRPVVRLLDPPPGLRHPHFGGVHTGDPASVAINVYAKGQVSAHVRAQADRPFAGRPIDVAVDLTDLGNGKLEFMRVTGRLVAPGYALGNILADLKTIPKSDRKRYQVKNTDGGGFDVQAYLADYERAKPDTFAVRDEVVKFDRTDDGTWKARIDDTRFPGVYRIGVQLEGLLVRPDGCAEHVRKVLHSEVALGIKPSTDRTRPELNWIDDNRFRVRLRVVDDLGNIGLTVGSGVVQLLSHREPVAAAETTGDDGTIELEVTARGKDAKVDQTGRSFGGVAIFDALSGRTITIPKGADLGLAVRIGSTVIPVTDYPTKGRKKAARKRKKPR